MTHSGRFQPVTGGPDDAYRSYDGAGIVSLAFALTDWWVRWRKQTPSRPKLAFPCARAMPFSLVLLAAVDGTALAVDASARLSCGGDYVCVAETPDSATSTAPQPAERAFPRDASVAVKEQCPQASIEVTAHSRSERDLVCTAAVDALDRLGRCHITLRARLNIEVLPEVRHPVGRVVFGFLDTRRQRVLVTQEAKIESLVAQTPYAELPRRDFYRSLIVHEVVHGVMDQNLKRPAATHAAYEYPAYALQLASLAPEVRDMFLRGLDQGAIRADALFADPVLFLDPYVFAARAYRHFNASADGCKLLNALLQGAADFILPAEM